MGYALEITGKAVRQIEEAQALIPPGTQINIAFLGNETHAQRFNAARVIRACGFQPVPIISSRRLMSETDAATVISGYQEAAAPERFLFVGGDPDTPQGPYQNSMELMKSGVLKRFGITSIGIVAYPEGHPAIPTDTLWQALEWKRHFLNEAGVSFEITTQFVLDPMAIPAWLSELRARGIANLVRLGVNAPAPAGRLLTYARMFGTKANASILARYQMPDDPALITAPEPFLQVLKERLSNMDTGRIDAHLYPFGGIGIAAKWAQSWPGLA
ncbi:hypothetical protein [Rhodobacter sp. 24-YEA-8]|uniref:hypothetical protein n=1 Tax=Rhodobacter sp. 24-YEA-8 TaxID=1884310 RepID=UPI000894DFD6|nr:hypothetical protein [Rhodobacter sp. 24-YEA-8]SED66038.1 methylenetetrahydrofolate reductase (NADPH) [Rhodobacter sp. 24-YEA-8]